MKKWEYIIVNFTEKDNYRVIHERITGLGNAGYELVTVTEDIYEEAVNQVLYIFKKPRARDLDLL